MLVSWYGDDFLIAGLLWRESTSHRWIGYPAHRISNVELLSFFVVRLHKHDWKKTSCQWFEKWWRSCHCDEMGIMLLCHTDDLVSHPYQITIVCLWHTDELLTKSIDIMMLWHTKKLRIPIRDNNSVCQTDELLSSCMRWHWTLCHMVEMVNCPCEIYSYALRMRL